MAGMLGSWLSLTSSFRRPEISRQVRAVVSDVIDAADNGALDWFRSRAIEQEVLDELDEHLEVITYTYRSAYLVDAVVRIGQTGVGDVTIAAFEVDRPLGVEQDAHT